MFEPSPSLLVALLGFPIARDCLSVTTTSLFFLLYCSHNASFSFIRFFVASCRLYTSCCRVSPASPAPVCGLVTVRSNTPLRRELADAIDTFDDWLPARREDDLDRLRPVLDPGWTVWVRVDEARSLRDRDWLRRGLLRERLLRRLAPLRDLDRLRSPPRGIISFSRSRFFVPRRFLRFFRVRSRKKNPR